MEVLKPLIWVGSCLKDMRNTPEDVQDTFGYALYLAQSGGRHPDAKSLHGFGGGSVIEVVEDDSGSTYRAVYTVKFAETVYALHVFQKKSKRGIATPKADVDLIKTRLKMAEDDYRARLKGKGS